MADVPLEKRFAVLCEIVRAQHFAWHRAVEALCPDVDVAAVTDKMWELTGVDTARAYLERVDRDAPLAPQLARSIAWSSVCMGEAAVAEDGGADGEAFVRHHACPWQRWHAKMDLVAEDQPRCDVWFQAMVDTINSELGSALRFETLETLPAGGKCCLRRLWEG